MTAPAMLAIDRRFVALEVVDDTGRKEQGGGHVVGDVVELRIRVENDSRAPIFQFEGVPFAADALESADRLRVGMVEPGRESAGTVEVTAHTTGRWVLQGFDVTAEDPFGLVRIRDYLPAPCVFEFYPAAGRLERSRDVPHARGDPRGRRAASRAGGMTVRELREYQPSDPLKQVAWKATIRLRRLISREFESPSTRPTSLVVDVSGSIRGPTSDEPKLEHVLETAAELADAAIRRRGRVALTTFGASMYSHVRAGRTPEHYRQIVRTLTGVRSVVSPDRTEVDEAGVAELLAEYLLVQERLDFYTDGDGVDRALLARWVEDRLSDESKRLGSPALRAGGRERAKSPLREFARLRGIPLAHRSIARSEPKEEGLSRALRRATAESNSPLRVIVLTDLCGMRHLDELGDALSVASGRGQTLEFWVPFTPAYYQLDADADERESILLELFSAAERTDRRETVEFLRERGVTVRVLTPPDEQPPASGREDGQPRDDGPTPSAGRSAGFVSTRTHVDR